MSAPSQHQITVVGLGPGGPEHLTAGAVEALRRAEVVWLRTARHPACAELPTDAPLHACDDLYESLDSFDEVYEAIVERLLEEALRGPVVYAVPGDPALGETSVRRLRKRAAAAGTPVRVIPGVSFLEPTLWALGWDGLDGMQVLDATVLATLHHPDLDPDRPAIIAQLYGRLLASDVKLVLLEIYPPDHAVVLVSSAGSSDERLESLPLAELDRDDRFDDRTTLAVPPLSRPGSLQALAEVVAHLRAPDGCPWDREQTHESLRPYLLEEAYEALHALDEGDPAALADELGDLLLQIVLHAQLASEETRFNMATVIAGITEKIVRRHPHVFGDAHARDSAEVRERWEDLKRNERERRGSDDHPLADLPMALPALARAQAAQRKLADAGRALGPGDGSASRGAEAAAGVLGRAPANEKERSERVGDALWSLVTLAAGWDVDAETALRETTRRMQVASRAWTARPTAAAGAPKGTRP